MEREMRGRLAVLLGILILAVIAWRVAIATAPPLSKLPTKPSGPPPEDWTPPSWGEAPHGWETLTVTIEIPPADQFPAGISQPRGCARSKLTKVLGIQLRGIYGVPVGVVLPDSPAAQAGILPGDLLGDREDCPSNIANSFLPRREARSVEWQVRRARQSPESEPGDAPPPEAG
jgi:hypothetical protein